MEKLKWTAEENIELTVSQIFHLIITTAYLIFLHLFNKKIEYLSDSPFELLKYDDYKALWYFVGCVILCVWAGFQLKFLFDRYKDYYHNGYYGYNRYAEEQSILYYILCTLLTFVLIVLLIIFINNPILRAIITVFIVLVGAGYFMANS